MKVLIKRLTETAKLPTRATDGSAAFDIYADEDCLVFKDRVTAVSTGISFEFPRGYKAEIVPRSGLAFKYGISIINTPATGDADFRGEYKIGLIKHTGHADDDFVVNKGDRIAQIMFIKVEDIEWEQVMELSNTERAGGGLGSTGK